MWIARDKDGSLYLFRQKPVKQECIWYVYGSDAVLIRMDADLFPEVKWDDDEPTEVEIVIKRREEQSCG